MSLISRLVRVLGFSGSPSKPDDGNPIRIGILGAAAIAPPALIYPSKLNSSTKVVAVAARDEVRAKAFAKKYDIGKVYKSYEELIADPDIDAVYVPSPNGHHYKWALMALEAGKHVLCEKPVTANAEEAEMLVSAAIKHKRVLMEAAHSFHHPSLIRAREIIRSGQIGEVKSVSARFLIPLISSRDIRYNVNGTQTHLAGGSFMDTGVYASHCVRFLTDLSFASCETATAKERFPGVDELMEAEISFENSTVKGHVKSSLTKSFPFLPEAEAEVEGTKGSLRFTNFVLPSLYHRIRVTSNETKRTTTETCYEEGRSTYEYQLDAFVKCIREQKDGGPAKTSSGGTVDDFVNTMKLIDGVYVKSGLGKRVGL